MGHGAGREEGIAKMFDSDTDVVGLEISQISSSMRCCSDSDCKRRQGRPVQTIGSEGRVSEA